MYCECRSVWLAGLRGFVFATAATLIIGCGPSRPPIARVQGMVTFEGKPLSRGTVTFIPDRSRGTKGRMAIGSIGPDGRFVMQSYAMDDGALVGFHKVTVSCLEDPPAPAEGAPAVPRGEPKSLIPLRYNDPEKSGLTVEVKPRAMNELVLELKDQKP